MPSKGKGFDLFLLISAFAAFSASSYLLIDDSWLFQVDTRAQSSPVAHFATSLNDVRRKMSDNFVWIPAETADTLFEGDSVFTGDQSEAVLKFQDGTEIGVSANSLLVVRTSESQMSLDLQFGDVVGRLKEKKSKLVIRSGKKETVLQGQEAEVAISRSSAGETRLQVVKGSVEVGDDGSKRALKKNQSLDLKKSGEIGKVRQSSIELLAPEFRKTVLLKEDQPTLFQWSPTQGQSLYRIEISRTRKFDKIIKRVTSTTEQVEVQNIPTGETLYWRVIAINSLGKKVIGASFPGQFKAILTTAPQPMTPENETQLTLEADIEGNLNEDQSIYLSWRAKDTVAFHLAVAADPKFQNIVSNQRVTKRFFNFVPNEDGPYYWRVRSQLTDSEYSSWSSLSRFDVTIRKPEAPLPAPQINESDIQYLKAETPLTLSWTAVKEANDYLVEISKDEDFTELILGQRSETTQMTWENSIEGEFFWRVSAMSRTDLQGRYSSVARIQVTIPLVPLVAPQELTGLVNGIFQDGQALSAHWKTVDGAQSYEIEISRDSDFSTALVQEKTEVPSLSFTPPESGKYFWRSRALRDDEMGPWSEIQKFVLKEASLPQIRISKSELTYESPAYKMGPGPQISWTGVKEASSYSVQISRDRSFSTLLVDAKTQKTQFRWPSYQLGEFFFRIQAQSKDSRSSPFAKGSVNIRLSAKAMDQFKVEVEELLDVYDTFKVDIRWKHPLFTESFRLKMGSKKNLSDGKVFSTSELTKSFKFKGAKVFYWAIQPLSGGKPISTYSATQKIDLKLSKGLLAAPELEQPENESTQFFQGTRFIKFTWSKVKSAESYELQVSKDETFSSPVISQEVKDLKFFWQDGIPNGEYYWRVRSANRRYKSRWSSPSQFFVTGP